MKTEGTLAVGLFRAVLALYPQGYRELVGAEAVRVFASMYSEAQRGGRGWTAFREGMWGAVTGLVPEWIEASRRRRMNRKGRGGREMGIQNLKLIVRGLLREPAFALTVVALLALGIGATTTLVSVVDAVLLRPLPYPDAERLVAIQPGAHSYDDVLALNERANSFEVIAGVRVGTVSVLTGDAAVRARAARITEGFLSGMKASLSRGRLLNAEDQAQQRRVAVVSNGFWERNWGGTDDVIGKNVSIDGVPHEVVGVLSDQFTAPEAITGRVVDLWIPILLTDGPLVDPQSRALNAYGKLHQGVTVAQANAETDRIMATLAEELPDYHILPDGTRITKPVISLAEATTSSIRLPLLILMGAAGLLLLIACANSAGLFLARGISRESDFAVRSAMGASRSDLMARVFGEGLVLAVAGGVMGVGIAHVGLGVLKSMGSTMLPRLESVAIDGRIMGWAALVALLTAVVFSALPAFMSSQANPAGVLRSARGGGSGIQQKLQSFLVMGEVAVTTILLLGAGLLIRSFGELTGEDTGMDMENAVYVAVPLGRQTPADERVVTVQALEEAFAAIPGALAAGGGLTVPFQFTGGGRCCFGGVFEVDGVESQQMWIHPVTPDFFAALDIETIEGRTFRASDDQAGVIALVVNERYVSEVLGGADPFSAQVVMAGQAAEIIGVVEDTRHWGFDEAPEAAAYVPWASQGSWASRYGIAIRFGTVNASTVQAVREAAQRVAPGTAVNILPYRGLAARGTARNKFFAALLTTFASVALLLAAGGLVGMLLFQVRQRRREVGIRLALGAEANSVAALVVKRGLATVFPGLVVGVLLLPLVSRPLGNLMYGVGAIDPLTVIGVIGVLSVTALLATWAPARVAAMTNPASVLKDP